MKKILIVEDNPRHREDAKKFFAPINDKVEITFALNCNEGMSLLEGEEWDAVLTDIFMPFDHTERKENTSIDDNQEEKECLSELFGYISDSYAFYLMNPFAGSWNSLVGTGHEMVTSVNDWMTFKKNAPLGYLIFKKCVGMKIPCALVTDQYHHGMDLELIHGDYRLLEDEVMIAKTEGRKYPKIDFIDGAQMSKNWASTLEFIKEVHS